MLEITRKAYLEVWGDEYVSRHQSLVDAVESAINQGPGTYQIRIGAEVYYEVTLTARSITVVPDASGNVDTQRPAPAAALDVSWSTVPNFENQLQSSAFSQELRTAYMSGTGAATAVISIIDISGDTAATLLATIQSLDFLSTPATVLGAGVFQLKASVGGNDFFSNSFALSIVTPASDTLAPTVPLIKSVTGTDTQNDIVIIPPSDPKSPASDANGMASVELHSKAGAGSFSLLATKSISAGISIQMSANTIGTHGVSPSSTQTGADWEVTAEGVIGLDSSVVQADDIYYISGPVSGDFDLTCRIPSYTAPLLSKTSAQLMVRETIAVDSKFITSGRLSNSASSPDPKFSEVKFRAVTGGSIQFANPQTDLSGDYYFWINRTGDVFTCYIFKQGDTGWTQNRQETIVMNANVQAGFFLNSGLLNTTATVDFEEVSLQNLALITHSDTGLTEDTLYEYKCKGVDATP